MGYFSSLRVGEHPRGVLGCWAERVGEKASCGVTATGLCDISLQMAHGMPFQRYTGGAGPVPAADPVAVSEISQIALLLSLGFPPSSTPLLPAALSLPRALHGSMPATRQP